MSEGDILDPKSSKRQKPSSTPHSRSQPVSPHTERSSRNKRDPSPTPSSSSETSSLVEQATASSRPPPPPCTVGEKVRQTLSNRESEALLSLSLSLSLFPLPVQVMVEIANGFKMGVVKFIGETEFAPGEWVGVALERPNGESVWFNQLLCCHGNILLIQGSTMGQ